MSITVRKLKDGTKVYDATLEYGMVDGKRERKVRTFHTLKEAQSAEEDASRLRNAMRNRSGRLTLSEYIERYYWPITSKRLEATSLETYKREIDKRILPCLGNVALEDIDRLKIQKMVDFADTESVGRKSLGLLKTILNEAMGDGFVSHNPALARYAMPKKGRKRDNGLILPDFAQIGEFVAEVGNDAPEAVVQLVMTGLTLGLRPEERYALDYEDFDYEDLSVHVHGAYVAASREFGGNQLKGTKTAYSNRVVPMTHLFADWFAYTDEGSGAWIKSQGGDRLSPSTGRKMWNRYLDAHPDLPRVTLENMRHSFSTACLHAGMNVEDLSRMLGHSDINTTFRRYVKPDLANIREGLAKIPMFD